MEFGIALIVRGPDATPASIRTLAEYAEEHGFASVWSSDHVVIPPVVKTRFPGLDEWRFPPHWQERYLSSLLVLTHAAAITERVLVGSSAFVLPLRNPIEFAKQAATLDVLATGRLVLAVTPGYAEDEFDVMGVPFGDRSARTDEYLRICRAMWTHDPASFHGDYYSFEGIRTGPRPVQRPHPPLFIGGWSASAIRRAARLGDGWHPASIAPDRLEPARDELHRSLEAVGRSPDQLPIWVKAPMCSGRTDEPGVTLQGTSGEIVATLKHYEKLGVRHVVLDWSPETLSAAMASLERFEREVRPYL